ncbi:MAG: YdcF family protein [Pseudomonadota bacterium]
MTRRRYREPETEADLRSQPGGPRRLFVFLSALLLGGLVGGFLAFAHYVEKIEPPSDLQSADGIVVWTGPGGGRLAAAGQLIEQGQGERLLISGVNRSLSLESAARLSGVSTETAECCVDVDYAALDTRGNARETAAWAQALGYDHIILVTSAYHMPRALVELSHEMSALRITPVPVQATDQVDWWTDLPRFRRLAGEYGKYLLSLARGRSASDTQRAPIPQNPVPEADTTDDIVPASDTSE